MAKRKRWQRVGALLDIPEDVTLAVSRVTIVGQSELWVENHGGVIEYTGELLRLKIDGGEIRISGQSLMLSMIEPEQVRVTGMVRAVQYA